MKRRHRPSARGFTLLEAVIVVLVLAVTVPSTVAWLGQAAAERTDSVNTVRASALAGAVLETVLADVCSTAPGMGVGALDNAEAYQNTPVTGLRARLAGVVGPYEELGFSYELGVSAAVDHTGATNADPALNVFRRVSVTVRFSSATGGEPINAVVEALVTTL